MEKGFLSLFITLASLLCFSSSQRCLESRLDYRPCYYYDTMDPIEPGIPKSNEYRITRTEMDVDSCRIISDTVKNKTIVNFGTDDMRTIYSPGFVRGRNYPNQLFVHYNVKCGNDTDTKLVFFNITDMDLQGDDCTNDLTNNNVCEDYILIDRGSYGTDEFCGNNIPEISPKNLAGGSVNIIFRTGERKYKKKGFRIYIICFNDANRSSKRKRNAYEGERCFNVKEFNSPICTNAPIQEVNSRIYNKFDVFSDVEYSEGCRQLSPQKFFQQQRVQRRSCNQAARVKEGIIIKKNEMVQFCHSLLSILDEMGRTRSSYTKVSELHTLDENWKSEVIFKCSKKLLKGPGELNIFEEHAYIQLFKTLDPKGNLPKKEEQLELTGMVTSFLNSVPAGLYEDDYKMINDTEIFNECLNDSTPPNCTRKNKIPRIVNGSREIGGNTTTGNTTTALFAALRNQNACNPVLRAQANATLAYFRNDSRFNQTKMEALKKFPIHCTPHSNCTLSCQSNSTTLPGRTLCMVPDETFMCEPFAGEPVNIMDYKGKTMKVRAVNCNGQQAEFVIQLEE